MIQDYFIESDCPDYTCTYDVYIQVTWSLADYSFDHEFGTCHEYGFEQEEVMIYKFVAYDEDGEIVDKFDIAELEDKKNYKKNKIYRKHVKIVQAIVGGYMRDVEPPDVLELE
jgi:hypothetical protein